MKLLFKQKLFSWFDSYDIYNEYGEVVFSVQGKLSWGHKFEIYDSKGCLVGKVKRVPFSFFPRFELYLGESCIGYITKEFSMFRPRFSIDCNGWQVEGSFAEWDYTIIDMMGNEVASISKQFFNLTDTYVLEINNDCDAVGVLMLALAIDAEKDSRN